jgi:hypothetical protein
MGELTISAGRCRNEGSDMTKFSFSIEAGAVGYGDRFSDGLNFFDRQLVSGREA